jgi:predicted SnoaL-like aldol condensation-catalyzing enzyme
MQFVLSAYDRSFSDGFDTAAVREVSNKIALVFVLSPPSNVSEEVVLYTSRFVIAAFAVIALQAPANAEETATEAKNKQIVSEFYEKGLNQKDADAGVSYLGARYTQHNPTVADGPEGFRKFIAFLKEKFPQARGDIKRIFADGDYVILHQHAVREPGTRGVAVIDIYKLENGKIIEHWDVIQPVPETTASGNSMF